MPAPIACICGYRGPAVTADGASVCPICRTPDGAPAAGVPAGSPPARPGTQPSAASPEPPWAAAPAATNGPVPAPPAPPAALHIPCPRGHVLEAPAGLLGQRVVCPQCNEFFVFDAENSVERRRQREQETAEREAREARQWLVRAIGVAALVLAALVAMIVASTLQR